ncbi:MAG: alpha/beta hydrolase fold domain-containing protein, partial [Proteobacteria bacterium]|nr:alpha/beta hydrolase fold domain-containing protein [Pseudomonadota bacterium]
MSDETVYLNYRQEELDAQYNNRARYPEYEGYFEDWTEWSAKTRERLPARLDAAYGDLPCETLDIFPAEQDNAPVQVMVHGGYWYSLDKHHDSFVAEGLRPNGVTTVVINYGLAPEYRMDEIVRQTRAALAWVWRHAGEFGADATRIHTVGQSAGGHLVLMLMATDWPAFGADQDLTQRMLTCPDLRRGQRSLLFNAVAGLPIVCLFLLLGALMYVYYQAHPEAAALF